jgi:hypothetical protein
MGVVQRFKGRVAMSVSVDKPVISGLVAHVGGGKANATVITNKQELIQIATVATTADSLLLPPAIPGHLLGISNEGANAAQIFGQGTDTINLVATATGVSHPASTSAMYFCAVRGNWVRVLSA